MIEAEKQRCKFALPSRPCHERKMGITVGEAEASRVLTIFFNTYLPLVKNCIIDFCSNTSLK